MRSKLFNDFDAFAESIKDVDSKMLMRNVSKNSWFTCLVELGPVDLQMGRLGSGNIAQGQLRSDGFMIYVPLTPGVGYKANGTFMVPGSCAIMEPGSEFCFSTRVAHDWLAAFLPSSWLPNGEVSSINAPTVHVTQPNRLAVNRLRKSGMEILKAADNLQEFEESPAATRAADEVREAFITLAGMSPAQAKAPNGRPRIPRQEIIRPCLELIEQQKGEKVTVSELLTAADVSERTLRNAFQEFFDVSPQQYLHILQLHRVHRALRNADPKFSSVGQILADHGEWAISRFASRYRRHFGELPSETLRNKGRK